MLFKKASIIAISCLLFILIIGCNSGDTEKKIPLGKSLPEESTPTKPTPVELTKIGNPDANFWVFNKIGDKSNTYSCYLSDEFYKKLERSNDYTSEKHLLGLIEPSFELALAEFQEEHPDSEIQNIIPTEKFKYLTNKAHRNTRIYMELPIRYLILTRAK